MNLKDKEVIVTRPYKTVYRDADRIIKVFNPEHGKSNVFNEAHCQSIVEETGLDVAKVLEVTEVEGKWALSIERIQGRTLASLMKEHPDQIKTYMEQFVDLQLEMHSKTATQLPLQKEKFAAKIAETKEDVNATIRYELCTRLDSMPNHTKLCHGDFNPTNVIVGDDGKMTIVDWAHATQGNASGDAAGTYLQFALEDQKLADLYLDLFCEKSDTAKQYVQKWMPIVAAVQLSKGIETERDFLMNWIDVIDFQ